MMRDEKAVASTEARQLLDNPAWAWSFDKARNELIAQIESFDCDGSKESRAAWLELSRRLQALISMKRELVSAIRVHNADIDKRKPRQIA